MNKNLLSWVFLSFLSIISFVQYLIETFIEKNLKTTYFYKFLLSIFFFWLGLVVFYVFIVWLWLHNGFGEIQLHSDFARDLYEISNIQEKKYVWLGPRLSAGFHASSIFYYLYYPGMLISSFSIKSMVVTNVIISALSFIFLAWVIEKKFGKSGVIPLLALIASPWWKDIVLTTGNGYIYAVFLLMALGSIWGRLPIFISSLLLGIAIAFHPVSIFLLPLFLYEFFRKIYTQTDKENIWKETWKNIFQLLLGLLLPWTPSIVFEVITKGFGIRQLLSSSGGSIDFGFSGQTFFQMLSVMKFSWLIFILFWLGLGFAVKEKVKMKLWFFWITGVILLFLFFKGLQPHYFHGVIALIWGMFIFEFGKKSFGKTLMGLLAIYFLITQLIAPWKEAQRSIVFVENTVDQFLSKEKISKESKIAVVSAMTAKTEVPQADDYRFLLRSKEYTVLDVDYYDLADTLVMFIEYPGFDWENWSNWEIERFGDKKIKNISSIDGVTIIIFESI